MRRLRILTFIVVVITIAITSFKHKIPSTIVGSETVVAIHADLKKETAPITPLKDVRMPDQTFLTFPEWYLVFSPAEQADDFRSNTSTNFPYLAHIDQFWKSYGIVYDQVKGKYKFNTGYHIMIMVIGVSTTVEYGVKSCYEMLIGRLTDSASGKITTEEDKFNAAYLRSYVNFIEDTPWYAYDFNHQLKELWGSTSFFGPNFLRKLERKYYLTTELSVKSAYGWLIGLGTKSTYETALLNTTVVVDKLPEHLGKDMKIIKKLPEGSVLMDLPRYARFATAVGHLAKEGINFKEIAGNNNEILLTVLTNTNLENDKKFKILFMQPIVTKPGLKRITIVTTVGDLSTTVQQLKANGATIAHIFDY